MLFHLYIGTTEKVFNDMNNGKFNDLIYLSDNMETFAHYYEGAVIQVEIELDPKAMLDYEEVGSMNFFKNNWGYITTSCPSYSNWFIVTGRYMEEHVKSIRILPDELVEPIVNYYSRQN